MPKDTLIDSQESLNNIPQVQSSKIEVVRSALKQLQESLAHIIDLLDSDVDAASHSLSLVSDKMKRTTDTLVSSNADSVFEGVFDGQQMIAHDGKKYDVPSNYASKSKLVEGDILKLTVHKNGTYLYKQISPVERQRIIGTLAIDEVSGNYYVMNEGRVFKVLPAAVTYHHGEVGDDAIVLVSKDGLSEWGAIENITKK